MLTLQGMNLGRLEYELISRKQMGEHLDTNVCSKAGRSLSAIECKRVGASIGEKGSPRNTKLWGITMYVIIPRVASRLEGHPYSEGGVLLWYVVYLRNNKAGVYGIHH